ncbi:type II toxin-antitoxin system Phd/YefM family antitoxin [Occultella kanbiaonis]|uniref:type II toxin-antitoxin system Phd/YefM family antitoxin n=1 Tax=Occultella kanbiaonis TaxID=2675754 RepID=UPI001A986E7B|nr:type II toxin-antitoxin system prevent-host-death family antitoxin [Occultella kanbiaonis]
MGTSMTVTEARAALPQLLDRVDAGEEVTITRHGSAVAVLVRPDALRTRRADSVLEAAHRLHLELEDARHQPLGEGVIDEARAAELLADLRAGRAAR